LSVYKQKSLSEPTTQYITSNKLAGDTLVFQ
jgi:hypothetical protein